MSVAPPMSNLKIHSGSPEYCFLNPVGHHLVVVPGAAGIDVPCRVVVRNRLTQTYTGVWNVSPGGWLDIPLSEVEPTSDHSITLQTMDGDRWRHCAPLRPIEAVCGDAWQIDPKSWGINSACWVKVRRYPSGRPVLHRHLDPDGSTVCSYTPEASSTRYSLEFLDDDGKYIIPISRLVEHQYRAPVPEPFVADDGLMYTVREDVVLSPVSLNNRSLRSKRAGSGLDTNGYLGAWAGGVPVPEAMEFALGRQQFLYQPDVPRASRRVEKAIYLGLPHVSFGHFLTQGLSRVWYALRHPDVPVVWDGPALSGYQAQIIDLIGLSNEQIFLNQSIAVDEAVFPFPGCGVGDFLLPAHARAIGLVEPSPVVPGKRLLLSRAGQERAPVPELDDLARRSGFIVYRPEEHSVDEQLAEMSSAEVVLGIEGSALHAPILLRDPVTTRFWSLARHRAGTGVFEHIKAAKSFPFVTLDFRAEECRGANAELVLDIAALERVLKATDGLRTNLDAVDDRVVRAGGVQTSFLSQMRNCQVRIGERETQLLAGFMGGSEDAARVRQWIAEWV